MRTHALIVMVLAWSALPVMAQGLGGLEIPGLEPTTQSTTQPVDPAADDLVGQLSAEEWDALLRKARPLLLERERAAVRREIEDSWIYDEDKQQQASASLDNQPANTPADNIQRILAAYALVDTRLAGPARKFADQDYQAACDEIKAILNPNGTSYLDAVRRIIYADSLAALQRHEDAAAAYREVLQTTPEKVSFAAVASFKAGQTYERMGRMMHAVNYYTWWLDNYGFLDPDVSAELAKKVAGVQEEYRDPLKTLAGKMDAVERRLSAADSGEQTQVQQRDIVRMLDDLIAMAQEQGGGGGGGSGSGSGQGSQGQSGAPPGGTGQPSKPAETSTLPPGNAPRPEGLAELRPTDSTDAWGKLPIREREKLVEMFKKQYPTRYKEMLEAYFRKLAEGQ